MYLVQQSQSLQNGNQWAPSMSMRKKSYTDGVQSEQQGEIKFKSTFLDGSHHHWGLVEEHSSSTQASWFLLPYLSHKINAVALCDPFSGSAAALDAQSSSDQVQGVII